MTRLTPLLAAATLLLVASPAAAFCGFYVGSGDAKLFNDATQVVLMRDSNQTVLSMQNSYEGPTEKFAMVVPVPVVLEKENVKTLPKQVFDKIDRITAPRLVEYWEQDPCKPLRRPKRRRARSRRVKKSKASGRLEKQGLVTVEAQFDVAEYEIVILSAKESTALQTWLEAEKYNIPDGAEPYFRPYIEAGQYFFVARVNPDKVEFEDGRAVLSPLRFDYEAEKFQLPIRLGMINSSGSQDLIAYVIAKNQRYEVANYDNAFIPTNLEVSPDVKENFGGFYQALFSRTAETNRGAVVTEYSWSTSSCDPCPGPTLSQKDLLTLGADVVVPVEKIPVPRTDVRFDPFGDSSSDNDPKPRRMRRARRPSRMRGWTVTRLHARYAPDEIGEDLVFTKAAAVSGGREVHDSDGALQKGARPSGSNQFQGRYIIRHEWNGPVECENPKFGRWGGPPRSGSKKPKVDANLSANTAGKDPRTKAKVDLAKLLVDADAVPQPSEREKLDEETDETDDETEKREAGPGAPEAPEKEPAAEQSAAEKPAEQPDRCTVAQLGARVPTTATTLCGILLLGLLRRRRKSDMGI